MPVPGRSSVDAFAAYAVMALRLALVSAVSRLRWVRLFFFSFVLSVGFSCGRGGFVCLFSLSSAPYSDHSAKLTTL